MKMRKVSFLTVWVLAILFSASFAMAVGLPMMYEITPADKANVILANLVEESLKKDSSGEAKIRGSVCTTPKDFLKAIQEYHSGVKLESVSELPTYLESLQLHEAIEGKFQMSRMLSCKLNLKGWTRSFMKNEKVWFDVNLGKPILAGFCTNVVGSRVGEVSAVVSSPEPLGQGPCGQGRGLIVNVWQFEELPRDLQEEIVTLVREQKTRDSFWDESVSRTLGREIRNKMASTASVSGQIQLQHLIVKDGDVKVVDTKPLGNVEIKHGYAHTRVPEMVTEKHHAVRVIVSRVLDGQVVLSPTAFGRTGEKELRLFGREWGNHCSMNIHLIVCDQTIANKIMQGEGGW